MKSQLLMKASVSLLAFVAAVPAAFAQDAAATAATAVDTPVSDAEIIVTGSRIEGNSTFKAPTPVTTLSQDQLVAAAPATIADALRLLPAIVPVGGPTAGGGTANGGQNFINMRGLGNDRTLVLVNGMRFVPAGPSGLIDTNLIPQGLVSRVDVVTGGASAAYGSDAVAGVANFVIDTRFKGLKLDTYLGVSQRGDNQEFKIQASGGFDALDGRLRVVASGEHYNSKGVSGDARDFRRVAGNQIRNPAATANFIRADDVRTPFTLGGLVVVGAGGTTANNNLISGLKFEQGGGTTAYNYGLNATTVRATSGTQDGGDGYSVSIGQEIVRPLKRDTAYLHTELDVLDNLTLIAEGNYGKTESVFENSPTVATLTVQRGNPFLAVADPALVGRMSALGVTSLRLNRLILERGPTLTTNENETLRGMFGIKADLLGLNWNAAYQYGRNDNHSETANNLITANLTRAVNAVSSGGQVVCSDTLSASAATRAAATGCVAFNPLGFNSPSDPALDYVMGTSVFDTRTTQNVFDATVSGPLFELPAGPLQFAAGYEWRKISANTVADALSLTGAYRLVNQQNFTGSYSINEFFGELQVPILKDSVIAQSFDINLAARHTDYSTSGGVDTWKVGFSWEINDWLRLRGTRSRDIRAPNLSELFAPGTGRTNTVNVPQAGGGVAANQFNESTVGNPGLRPEVAKTYGAGLVFTPTFVPGLAMSVDYYKINLDGSIDSLTAQTLTDQCYLQSITAACSAISTTGGRGVVTPGLAVTSIEIKPTNFVSLKTSGIDFEASYRGEFGPGNFTLRALASHAIELTTDNGVTLQTDAAGQNTGSLPKWTYRFTAAYDFTSGFGIQGVARGVSGGVYNNNYIVCTTDCPLSTADRRTVNLNSIPGAFFFDLNASYNFEVSNVKSQVFLSVRNVTNKDPVLVGNGPTGNNTPAYPQTNRTLYDVLGRVFRMGVRLRV